MLFFSSAPEEIVDRLFELSVFLILLCCMTEVVEVVFPTAFFLPPCLLFLLVAIGFLSILLYPLSCSNSAQSFLILAFCAHMKGSPLLPPPSSNPTWPGVHMCLSVDAPQCAKSCGSSQKSFQDLHLLICLCAIRVTSWMSMLKG